MRNIRDIIIKVQYLKKRRWKRKQQDGRIQWVHMDSGTTVRSLYEAHKLQQHMDEVIRAL